LEYVYGVTDLCQQKQNMRWTRSLKSARKDLFCQPLQNSTISQMRFPMYKTSTGSFRPTSVSLHGLPTPHRTSPHASIAVGDTTSTFLATPPFRLVQALLTASWTFHGCKKLRHTSSENMISEISVSAAAAVTTVSTDPTHSSPKMYYFNLRGSAFLWHQVRHMIAILF